MRGGSRQNGLHVDDNALIKKRCQLEVLAYRIAKEDLDEFQTDPYQVLEKIKQILP